MANRPQITKVRVEFLTQDDPLYIVPFFDEFLRHYASAFELTQVTACRVMGKRPRAQLFSELLALYGVAGFARIAGRVLVASVLGRLPRGRASLRFFTLAQLCAAYDVPHRRGGDPNRKEYVEELARRKPDVLVSVACPYVLKDALLGLPARGCINIHHAPLPRYKGMMPSFWQMYHGERTMGLTVHYMAARVDEGAALLQDALAIEPGETLDHLIRRSKRHAAHCLARVLRQMEQGVEKAVPLGERGSYYTFPTHAEIREFHRRALRAI